MVERISILTLLGLVIGAVVGVLAVGFVELVLWLNDAFQLMAQTHESIADPRMRTAIFVGIPTLGGLVVGLLSLLLPGNQFHGLQNVIEITHSANPVMPARRSLVSSLAAVVSLGAGASVGQYGPLAHMGASIGSWISRITRGDRSIGMIGIACGCAAARAPLGPT